MQKRIKHSQSLVPYAFIAPAVIFMLIFCVYPILYNVITSFQDMDMLNFRSGAYKFVGFQQYIDLFADKSGIFQHSFYNTVFYTVVSIFFQFLIGFAFALLFSKSFPLSGFMRGLLMLAWLLPHTVTGLLGKYLFSENGIINDVLMNLGLIQGSVGWLVEKSTALNCVILMNIWVGIPYNMMLLATGLTTIPDSVYESAAIDGANKRQRLFYITIPMIRPTILTVLVLGFINTFKVFDLVYVMTNGGPVHYSEVLASISYQYAFNNGAFSKGCATANILFVILFVVSLFYQKMIQSEEGM